MKFKTSQLAFESLYDRIDKFIISPNGTKILYNASITIEQPMSNDILTPYRIWKKS